MATYEVQGRRTERGPDGKPREVVKLDTASERHVAFAIAETMAADRLTVWVFERHGPVGRTPVYKLLGTVTAPKR